MRNGLVGSTLVALALLAFTPGTRAQISAKPGPRAASAIPDLSGNWQPHRQVPVTAETALCGIRVVCNGLQGAAEAREPMGEKPEEPEMQPWAEEKYKAARVGRAPNEFGRQDLDPTFSGCMPQGPTDLMLDEFRTFELRQFPDEVLFLFDQDHLVRRIYLDGRGHPESSPSMWMGHSIGKYEGDTLVVDTVGLNDKTRVDRAGHPHSDALHFVERIRRVNQNSLEYVVTIDDPKTYKKPWTRKVVQDLLPSNFQILEEVLCEELLDMGTHYSAKSKK
jgi:hypothetical protein